MEQRVNYLLLMCFVSFSDFPLTPDIAESSYYISTLWNNTMTWTEHYLPTHSLPAKSTNCNLTFNQSLPLCRCIIGNIWQSRYYKIIIQNIDIPVRYCDRCCCSCVVERMEGRLLEIPAWTELLVRWMIDLSANYSSCYHWCGVSWVDRSDGVIEAVGRGGGRHKSTGRHLVDVYCDDEMRSATAVMNLCATHSSLLHTKVNSWYQLFTWRNWPEKYIHFPLLYRNTLLVMPVAIQVLFVTSLSNWWHPYNHFCWI